MRMFKKLSLKIILTTLLLLSFAAKVQAQSIPQEQIFPRMIYFYGDGCPHCENTTRFLLLSGFGEFFKIERREVYFDKTNAQMYSEIMDTLGVPTNQQGVPALVIGDERVIFGDQPIIDFFIQFYPEEG